MKLISILIVAISILISGCFVTPGSIQDLNERQDNLEARMDELLEELKATNSNIIRNMERIEKNQLLLAQEVESIQQRSIKLNKKIDDVTKKGGNGQKPPSANEIYSKADASYKNRKYEEAILQFQQLIDTYPKDWRVPNAYLKQGNSLINLGRKKEAGFFFKTLIDKYPNSPEANIARQKLKAI